MKLHLLAILGTLPITACVDPAPAPEPHFGPPGSVDVQNHSPQPLTAPDLRFQWVGAFSTYLQGDTTNIIATPDSGALTISTTGELAWSPLQLTGDGSWELTGFAPAVGIESVTSVAQAGPLTDVEADTAALLEAHGVVTSLDYGVGVYAMVVLTPTDGEPSYRERSYAADRAGLATWAAMAGAQGFVITALTGDGTAIHALAFSPEGETQTYETEVVDATTATLALRASELAAGGYTVTAFGRNGDAARILVGTRPSGAMVARSIAIGTSVNPSLAQGYAIVAWDFDPASATDVVILER